MIKRTFLILVILGAIPLMAGERWYEVYGRGVTAMKQGRYAEAIIHFQKAISKKSRDTGRIRAYGTVFVDYFPNREIGICYYFLGEYEKALQFLKLSMSQKPSNRAKLYLAMTKKKLGVEPPPPATQKPAPGMPTPTHTYTPTYQKPAPRKSKERPVERMKIAVLPFETKGLSVDIGDMVLDKMITSLVNLGRFDVMERAELEKVLQEQQLEISGIVDAATAARVGKGIGLDAILLGSVSSTGGTVSLDARLIDTETAGIITSKDAYVYSKDITSIKKIVDQIANQIVADVPEVEGYVVQVEDTTIFIDIGSDKGIKKGLKVVVYREGEPIKNPVTGEVLGKKIIHVCEAVARVVQPKLTECHIVKSTETPRVGDRVITK